MRTELDAKRTGIVGRMKALKGSLRVQRFEIGVGVSALVVEPLPSAP